MEEQCFLIFSFSSDVIQYRGIVQFGSNECARADTAPMSRAKVSAMLDFTVKPVRFVSDEKVSA